MNSEVSTSFTRFERVIDFAIQPNLVAPKMKQEKLDMCAIDAVLRRAHIGVEGAHCDHVRVDGQILRNVNIVIAV